MIANGVYSRGDHPVVSPVLTGLMIVLSGAGVAIESNRGHALLVAAWVATIAPLIGLNTAIS